MKLHPNGFSALRALVRKTGRPLKGLAVVAVAALIGFSFGYRQGDTRTSAFNVSPLPAHATGSTMETARGPMMAGNQAADHAPVQGASDAETLYVCPMNCTAPASQPGKCPVCGMDLVPMNTDGAHTGRLEMPGPTAGGTAPPPRHDHAGHLHLNVAAEETESETLYVCPMNCTAPVSQPGKCPVCGMDLVPMNTDGTHTGRLEMPGPTAASHGHMTGAPESPSVTRLQQIALSPEAVQKADIRLATVEERFVSTEIRLYGKIEYDPVEQYKVTAFAPGVIDNIYAKRAGQAVRRGDPLFDLHSSELYYLEQELFTLLEKLPYKLDLRPGKGHGRKRIGRWTRLLLPNKPGQDGMMSEEEKSAFMHEMDGIKRKMRLLGLSDEDIDEAIVRGRPTGISTVTTPMTGVILEQNAYRGAYVNTGDVVFTIANPRVLWARLDAYASDFPWLRLGQEATFETDAYPGHSFAGKVIFIDPEFSPDTRVFKVGVLYRDDKGLLKPNMLVRAVVHASMKAGGRGTVELVTQGMMGTAQTRRTDQAPLVIPDTAPLITGNRAVVYVAVSGRPGVFEGREIKLGPRADDVYIVWEGLAKGEQVVVNGNFKIDSAVQILAGQSMMAQKGGTLLPVDYDRVSTPEIPPEAMTEHLSKGAKFELHTGYGDRVQ